MEALSTVFMLLLLAALAALIVGLVRPDAVIRWGNGDKTRKRVLKVYGLATLALFFLIGITAPSTSDDSQTDASADASTQPQPRTAQAALAELERERAAGRPQVALQHARTVVSEYPGTPEADSAAKLLPALETAVEDAAGAERTRVAEAAAGAESRRLADKWTYSSEVDPMTSGVSKTAVIQSENTVTFDFPYQGAQHGTLLVRDHPSHGRDVILAIERGQILCQSYEDCQIRVRFDEGSPKSWDAVGPGDNSSTAIFLRNQGRFREQMRAAKTVRIQVPVYDEGEQIFEFHVGGFDSERFADGR